MSDAPDSAGFRPDTRAIHAGIDRSHHLEMSEGLFLTQGYVYDRAADAEAAFAGELDVYMYSRFGNPTVTAFEERLRAIEGAEACLATATGMAAVFTSLASILTSGDRLVASRALFGSSIQIFDLYFSKWGVTVEYVDGHVLEQWGGALKRPAKAVFFETPTNPMQDIVDVRRVAELAHAAGAFVVVDNVFATPIGQRPLDLGADVVVYSGTKHIDGQGRVMGGAILGAADYIDGPVMTMLRQTGPTLSPFNAWVLLKGLETMAVRVRQQTASALEIAAWLEARPEVARVLYPFLPSHPQHELALSQMTIGGTVVTLDLAIPQAADAKERAFKVMDSLRLFELVNNFADAKSIVTHPATTFHRGLGEERRAAIGESDATIRLSIGLEDVEDLKEDLERALATA
ncbi:MAG: O-succinylhomoserine sulfhydrylase [Demequinaceae bacterium]|nr:O-succinylhomoserine sulfhydrylase [Demequinaceae bacterium]